jgi:anti-sigma B factor antagonist
MNILEHNLPCGQSIAITGRLDSASFHLLEARFAHFLAAQTRFFIVDCTNLNYLSSAGLRVLLSAAKKVSPVGGAIALWGAKDHVREVVNIAGLTEILKSHAREEDAAAYLISKHPLNP